MNQLSLSFDTPTFQSDNQELLYIKDKEGLYQVADVDQILAAARTAADNLVPRGTQFTRPELIKEYLTAKLSGIDREVFSVLLLNNKHYLIGYYELFHGTLSQANVYPREVARLALAQNAAAMVLAHNHPSGHPTPSDADRKITAEIKRASCLIDVRVLDHIIIGGSEAVSFAEAGLL